jgi:uncharacterized protein (DUF697 family)/predicted GTPase
MNGKTDDAIARAAATKAPVVWLIGKVQSGKSSIVHALTGSPLAAIGEGFKPCTRTAALFDFPAEAPVVRFLDTRGLGEAGYDASPDIAVHEQNAHVLLAVMKALDPQQGEVVKAVGQARRKHGDWPVIVAQTTLHEAYPVHGQHPDHYPFANGIPIPGSASVSQDLSRALAYQRSLFDDLPGQGTIQFVPLDFTKPGDGYDPRLYGLEALTAALETALPQGVAATVTAAALKSGDAMADEAEPHIYGYASAAAAVDALPAAGLVGVPVIQSKMLHSLGRIYGVEWDRQTLTDFGACLGVGVISRLAAGFGVRQIAKFIPLYGQTAGAAAASAISFATTVAIGKAACLFLTRRLEGRHDPSAVAAEYKAALSNAFNVFRQQPAAKGHAA